MVLGELSDRSAFQVEGVSRGCLKQVSFHGSTCDDFGSGERGMAGQAAEPLRQSSVWPINLAVRQHARRDNNRPRAEARIKTACQSKADKRVGAVRDKLACHIGRALRCTAARSDQTTESSGNPGLGGQTDDESEGQKPNSTRRVLPRVRLRKRARARSGKYSR